MNRKVILDESQEVGEVNPSKTRGRKPLRYCNDRCSKKIRC